MMQKDYTDNLSQNLNLAFWTLSPKECLLIDLSRGIVVYSFINPTIDHDIRRCILNRDLSMLVDYSDDSIEVGRIN